MAMAEVDPAAAIDSVRAEIDHMADRRPNAYRGSLGPRTVVASTT
jgi:hypothetical protein